MRYGLRWYRGIAEHGYEECGHAEHASVCALMADLVHNTGGWIFPEDWIFNALCDGRQDAIHWITDDCGFEFYRPDGDK